MKNQREIIRNIRSMSLGELLDLVVDSPFFLTDAYYVEIGKAVRDRHAKLKSDFLVYYSCRTNWEAQDCHCLWVPVVQWSQKDICLTFPPPDIVQIQIEAGAPVVILAGSHSGCVEVVARKEIRSTAELKGKTVAISELGGDEHIFISMFTAYVGLNPRKDINWVVYPIAEHVQLFNEQKIDAFFTGPPSSLELREKEDRPHVGQHNNR